ncbi:hypothetical protein CLF_101882, partial [Clonorchis sinensis]
VNDKNKTDPGNLGKSLAPVYQSVNPVLVGSNLAPCKSLAGDRMCVSVQLSNECWQTDLLQTAFQMAVDERKNENCGIVALRFYSELFIPFIPIVIHRAKRVDLDNQLSKSYPARRNNTFPIIFSTYIHNADSQTRNEKMCRFRWFNHYFSGMCRSRISVGRNFAKLFKRVSVATSNVLTPTYTQTHLHIGKPSTVKTHKLAGAQGLGRHPLSTSPRTIWNTCSNYAAEKTRYRRPDFHQGTLTTDKFPFCLAPHSGLYLFLYVLQLTTVNLPTYTQTQLHIGKPSILKTPKNSRARREQDVNQSPQVHGQLWNTCNNYAAEKTRYRRPDFHQGTLTTDKYPFLWCQLWCYIQPQLKNNLHLKVKTLRYMWRHCSRQFSFGHCLTQVARYHLRCFLERKLNTGSGNFACGTAPRGALKHWISDRTVALLKSRRNIPAGPEHNLVLNQSSNQFISYKPYTIGTLVPAATVSITGNVERKKKPWRRRYVRKLSSYALKAIALMHERH